MIGWALQLRRSAILGGLHAAVCVKSGSVWLSSYGGGHRRSGLLGSPKLRNVFRCTLPALESVWADNGQTDELAAVQRATEG